MLKELSYVLFVVGGLNLVLGGAVLFYGARQKANRFFFLIALLLALWSVFHGLSITAPNNRQVLLWTCLIMLPGVLLPYAFLRFSQELTGSQFRRKRFSTIIHVLAISGLLAYLFDEKLIASAEMAVWGVNWAPGPLFTAYALYFAATMGFGLWILGRKIRETEGQRRSQMIYVFIGMACSIGSGLVVNIIHPMIGITTFNKYGPLGTVCLAGFIAHAILKHRLMDITIFMRRAALLVTVYAFLILVGGGAVYFVHGHRFGPSSEIFGTVFAEALILAVCLSVGPFVYAYLIRRSSFFHEHELAGLTHDLKSPLGGIHGALDFLEGLNAGQVLRDKDVEYIQMAKRNVARMEEAVNDLLTIFQIPTKSEAFDIKVHDLGEIVQSVTEKYRDSIESKGLTLEMKVPQSGPTVLCDAAKLQQVISNLIANAVKYTRAGKISVAINERETEVSVQVDDSGEGIPAHELPRVFDRLFQGATSRKLKGSGLGLTIAKTWVEAHGGEIHAESDGEGKGSRFWFTLPKR